MLNNLIVILVSSFIASISLAEVELNTVRVMGDQNDDLPLSRINKESVVKKETISQERIEHKNATSLSKAIDLEPGVQTTLTCATCGSQRITLNGMRGENTTVLIDGVPAYSSVSSFYGMEAIPMSGLSSIEIMRGAGSSLTAPESIGGAVNIVTKKTDQKKFSYLVRAGENNSFNQQVQGIYGNIKSGTLIAAQTNELAFFDEDNNNVAESSSIKQKAAFIKHDQRFGSKIKFSLRAGVQDLELLGGATKHFRNPSYPTSLPDETSFEEGDVRRSYTGSLEAISDWIKLNRVDAGASLLYHIDSETNIKFSTSLAKQKQESIYSHGYDYNNDDMFRFYDLKVNHLLGSDHLLTIGVDHKNEDMVSSSELLYEVRDYYRDSFNFDTIGFYIQDEWFITDKDEINLVLRYDNIHVDWKDKRLSTNTLNESVLAPRIHYKRVHTDTLSSRFSLGVGYRAPLTLFESQHGTNEDGFELNIKKLEKAQTFTYTLNRETKFRSSALSGTLTHLENMAYGEENDGEAINFKNTDEEMNVATINLLHVERLTSNWNMEASFDWFIMPESYKRKLPAASQEMRARFISDYHFGKSEFVTTLNIIGPRNLSSYNYDLNYNVLEEDPLTFEDVPSEQKDQDSPLYYTIDLYFQTELTKNLRFIAGVTNLLDYTQTKDKESPLSWRIHGDHVHLDNRHIWGPTQGRVLYTGLNYEI